ncbi:Galactoside 2-alpha-L-fucosyltransferase 2 [Amphibalanus amphitrite]|uniref:L-Fucosyltransferase n=1 Tax=Amphibalanus amphitrite TaxID=1232801 RepID=A0A6A4WHG4_AMPAM|nr:Galactoside 2-alpha-L-fucosyltransferase 2 [Amphibalanus amphitrite]
MVDVCGQLGHSTPPAQPTGCRKAISYDAIGRLGNLMGLYAIIYSLGRSYGATGYVESGMWGTLHKYFPGISLKSVELAPQDAVWEDITYQEVHRKLECQPGENNAEPSYYRIMDWPARNGIDVFHPFRAELRHEFTFAAALQDEAQTFLRSARGNRTSATYIGFHVRRTDFEAYVRKKYGRTLPDVEYFERTLTYYRERFSDALFIVCSDDIDFVTERLNAKQNDDILIAGNRDISDPGRDMALLSACNHSVVTVGTYGFWGAYLAGGTVLAPDEKAHLSRADGSVPLMVVQKAGATNWVMLWS